MNYRYQQLADELVEQIYAGLYRAGERLPGVRSLSEQRGVSVATAVAAYRQLEDKGFLDVRDRSGFYVRPWAQTRSIDTPVETSATGPCEISGQELQWP